MFRSIQRGALALLAMVAFCTAQAQTYFINEDFSTGSGTTLPAGWANVITAGNGAFDLWRFSNDGARAITSPMVAPAAIFDSDFWGALVPENVSLVSPSVNTTGYGAVRLKWDQDYHGGYQSGDAIFVEVWDGTTWNVAYTYNLFSTSGAAATVGQHDVDVSAFAANRPIVQVRFRFVGNLSWWWIVDNVQLYANPSIVSIARASPNPTAAASVSFTVTFSESVTGVDASDFTLTTMGLTGASVTGVTGSGATRTVTVSTGSGDGTLRLDLVDDDSIAGTVPLGGAGAGNGSFAAGEVYTIDKTAPAVTINQVVAQVDPAGTSPILFTVVFSEAVTGFTSADVSFAGSTAGGTLVAGVSGSGTTYTVSVTGMTSAGTVVASIPAGAASDLVGNPTLASTSTDNSVTFSTAPTVTINQAAGRADPTNASPVLFTAAFNQPVAGFTASDVSFAGSTASGTLAAVVSGGPATYTVTVTGMTGSGTVVASIPAGAVTSGPVSSLASTSTDNTVTFDNVPPNAVVQPLPLQPNPATTSPILFAVNFTEPVIGFTNSDVGFTGSTVAGLLIASVSGSGATYTVSVSGMTSNGFVLLNVPAGAVTDLAGNPNFAAAVIGGVTYTGASAVVTTFTAPSATGTGNITASFTGGGPTCTFTGQQYIAPPPGTSPVPPAAAPGVFFPHGLFTFSTTNCTAGSTLAFTITYPGALPAGTQYWKYGPAPGNATSHWYVLPAVVAGNVVTFTITDGGLGDDDLAANGTIVDQGGPGAPGLGTSALQTPTLGEWSLILLALLLLGFAASAIRRRG